MWNPHARPWRTRPTLLPPFLGRGWGEGVKEVETLSFSFLCRMGRKFPVPISAPASHPPSPEKEKELVALGCPSTLLPPPSSPSHTPTPSLGHTLLTQKKVSITEGSQGSGQGLGAQTLYKEPGPFTRSALRELTLQ